MAKCKECVYQPMCYKIEQFGRDLETDEACDHFREAAKMVEVPVNVGDTVYVICNCTEVSKELDGTLWDVETGGYRTATGYYCPFEYECEDEECSDTNKIFETVVTYICCNDFSECKKWEMYVENLKPTFLFSDFGKTVFLTRKEAEKALAERSNEE